MDVENQLFHLFIYFLPHFFLRSLNNFLWDVLRCHVNKSSDQNDRARKMLTGLKTHQDR